MIAILCLNFAVEYFMRSILGSLLLRLCSNYAYLKSFIIGEKSVSKCFLYDERYFFIFEVTSRIVPGTIIKNIQIATYYDENSQEVISIGLYINSGMLLFPVVYFHFKLVFKVFSSHASMMWVNEVF